MTKNLIEISQQLNRFLQGALKLINSARLSKRLVALDELLAQDSKAIIEARFAKPLAELQKGYIKSDFFEPYGKYKPIDNIAVEGEPLLCYRIKADKLPSDAICDLFSNPASIAILDCQSAILLAQYYAILNTLQELTTPEKGNAIFNQLLHTADFHLIIHRFGAPRGTSKDCTQDNGMLIPLAPITYFVKQSTKASHEIGALTYFANHPDYRKKHPHGAWQGEALICSAIDPLRYIGYGLDAEQLTSAELREFLQNEYNKDCPRWMQEECTNAGLPSQSDKGEKTYPDRIQLKDVRGFTDANIIIDPEKILEASQNPIATFEKLKLFLENEHSQINKNRAAFLNIELNITSENTQDKLQILGNERSKNYSSGMQAFRKEDYATAKVYFELALKLSRKIYLYYADKQNYEKMIEAKDSIGTACINLGSTHKALKDFQAAEKNYQEAYEIYLFIYGVNSDKVEKIKNRLAELKVDPSTGLEATFSELKLTG